jgi:SPP1 family predicted phage head-tail adaptor
MKLTFLDPGQLRTEMMLQNIVESADGCGGVVVTWADVALVWTAIETVSPRTESFGGRQIDEASHRVTMRHRGDVKPGQRLVHVNKNYRIQLVADADSTARYVTCYVLEERP